MQLPQPPDPSLGERQTWHRGEWSCALDLRNDGLHLTILGLGRDQEVAFYPEEEAWVEAAARRVPGVTRQYAPDWSVPPAAVAALAQALDIGWWQRTLQAPRWLPALSLCLQGEGSLLFDWRVATATIDRQSDAATTVQLQGGPGLDALAVRLGAQSSSERRLSVRPNALPDALNALVAWQPARLRAVHGWARLDVGLGAP